MELHTLFFARETRFDTFPKPVSQARREKEKT